MLVYGCWEGCGTPRLRQPLWNGVPGTQGDVVTSRRGQGESESLSPWHGEKFSTGIRMASIWAVAKSLTGQMKSFNVYDGRCHDVGLAHRNMAVSRNKAHLVPKGPARRTTTDPAADRPFCC